LQCACVLAEGAFCGFEVGVHGEVGPRVANCRLSAA
jgi:hypothetical protein